MHPTTSAMGSGIPPRRVVIVTRHAGARTWLQAQFPGVAIDFASHMTAGDTVEAGDVVCGVVPMHLAAQLCRQGALVVGIDLPLPEALRGLALDAAALDSLGARLTRYRVLAMPWPTTDHCTSANAWCGV